ncbi:WD repeat-containing protein 46 [Palaemon carinicauda]|uniref:WD repeat-containing protein 46 n=1 Tax=Palaemon carinicauda TaxID=392227 RepID=UPI0035B5D8D8
MEEPSNSHEPTMTSQQFDGEDFKWQKRQGQWQAMKVEVKDGVKIKELNNFSRKRPQKFPGRKPLHPSLQQKYTKGEGMDASYVRKAKHKTMIAKLKRREKKLKEAEEEAARAEILLTESSGLLETEEGTYTANVSQTDIRNSVDITSAAKGFELTLKDFGPYKMQFTRNGRHLLLGGRKGHLAAFDWITKKLHYEINVMESIHDVCWLNTEQLMAVAQKKWVYMYDNSGIEVHCVKKLGNVYKMEYLPYHFLLCTGGESGFLNWLDISLGQELLTVQTHKGRLEIMRQNPYNGVICCGHSNGTVTMWTPNEKKPVASVLCHISPVRAIEFDPAGRIFATAGIHREVKIWDARNLGDSIYTYKIRMGASMLAFSQKQMLAVAMGNVVEVYDRVAKGVLSFPYMRHECKGAATGMQFCSYEDVLGVSTYTGYSSLLIPGAGEPNFDALEANPYLSTSGRREAEIKSLLGKVPHELITLDPCTIAQVDVPRLEEKLEAKRALKYVKVPKLDVQPRYRMKGKSGSAQKFKRKQKTLDIKKREYIKDAVIARDNLGLKEEKRQKPKKSFGLLDRFHSKTQK